MGWFWFLLLNLLHQIKTHNEGFLVNFASKQQCFWSFGQNDIRWTQAFVCRNLTALFALTIIIPSAGTTPKFHEWTNFKFPLTCHFKTTKFVGHHSFIHMAMGLLQLLWFSKLSHSYFDLKKKKRLLANMADTILSGQWLCVTPPTHQPQKQASICFLTKILCGRRMVGRVTREAR